MKLTRNAYKRRIIVFGVFLFMSIALISTGFAAWVMSAGDDKTGEGNVTVGIVTDATLSLTVNTDEIEAFEYRFEPKSNDTSGRVRLPLKQGSETEYDNSKCEQLNLNVYGTVTNLTSLKGGVIKVTMTLPKDIKKAVAKHYYTLKIDASESTHKGTLNGETEKTLVFVQDDFIEIEETDLVKVEFNIKPANDGSFNMNFDFVWGSLFGGENPSIYYDKAPGTNTTKEDVIKVLEEIRASVYNYFDELLTKTTPEARKTLIDSHNEVPTFNITFVAESNS